jgi:hypothetical protein
MRVAVTLALFALFISSFLVLIGGRNLPFRLALLVLAVVVPITYPRFVISERGVTNWQWGWWRRRWAWGEIQGCRVAEGGDTAHEYAAQIMADGRWRLLAVLESSRPVIEQAVRLIGQVGRVPQRAQGKGTFSSF